MNLTEILPEPVRAFLTITEVDSAQFLAGDLFRRKFGHPALHCHAEPTAIWCTGSAQPTMMPRAFSNRRSSTKPSTPTMTMVA